MNVKVAVSSAMMVRGKIPKYAKTPKWARNDPVTDKKAANTVQPAPGGGAQDPVTKPDPEPASVPSQVENAPGEGPKMPLEPAGL